MFLPHGVVLSNIPLRPSSLAAAASPSRPSRGNVAPRARMPPAPSAPTCTITLHSNTAQQHRTTTPHNNFHTQQHTQQHCTTTQSPSIPTRHQPNPTPPLYPCFATSDHPHSRCITQVSLSQFITNNLHRQQPFRSNPLPSTFTSHHFIQLSSQAPSST